MQDYQPLRNLTIFVNDQTSDFIVANHTSHANVKVSLGYSNVYVYVNNNQASSYYQPERAAVYIDALIEKYKKLRDKPNGSHIDWPAIHQDAVDKLQSIRDNRWAQLGQL